MKIYLATNNKNKKYEMTEILAPHAVVIPSDEGIGFNPDETGTTFYENSLIKARALYEIVRCPVIADDSGICVDALGGRPGIYSSRYTGASLQNGKELSQKEKNALLIAELNDALLRGVDASRFLHGERSAHYTCAMVLYLGNDRLYVAEETLEGAIVNSMENARGEHGFGYDPIFLLPECNRTVAELSDDEKNAISHRGKAGRAMQQLIRTIALE
ncbi:MAG: RdgB/HAM1 family non-canonical purine NTP pyrophosphatase [Treponema sp.]|nr:RdgB/HAM1 family non-canonical purine NTP pyrophosphatase [Treponema sp.]